MECRRGQYASFGWMGLGFRGLDFRVVGLGLMVLHFDVALGVQELRYVF